MHHLNSSLPKASILVLFVLANLVVSLGPAEALPRNEIERWYFSDASLTIPVGWSITLCDGSRARWGVTTGDDLVVYTDSCSTGSRRVACYIDGFATTCPADICSFSGVTCYPITVPCTIGGHPATCSPSQCVVEAIHCL